MKHRSTHIFILVAALLVAAPQASQELSDMKDALGGRLKAEIFNAFLSLQTVEGARPAPLAGHALVASAAAAPARSVGRQARAAEPQVEVHARREVPAELPSEVEPVIEIAALEPELAEAVAPATPAFKFELHDAKLMRGGELSIIVPPDTDFTAPPPPARVARAGVRARVAPRVKKAAELERATAHLASVGDVLEFRSLSREEALRGAETLRRVQVEVEADDARRLTRVLKLKRAAPKPAAAPPPPPARAACPPQAAAAAASMQVTCGLTEAQSFYVTE